MSIENKDEKQNGISFIVSIAIIILFLSLVGMFYFTIKTAYDHFDNSNYDDFNSVDAISLQITLLQILIGSFALGIGALGIIGWKEIHNRIETSVSMKVLGEMQKRIAKDTEEMRKRIEKDLNNKIEKKYNQREKINASVYEGFGDI